MMVYHGHRFKTYVRRCKRCEEEKREDTFFKTKYKHGKFCKEHNKKSIGGKNMKEFFINEGKITLEKTGDKEIKIIAKSENKEMRMTKLITEVLDLNKVRSERDKHLAQKKNSQKEIVEISKEMNELKNNIGKITTNDKILFRAIEKFGMHNKITQLENRLVQSEKMFKSNNQWQEMLEYCISELK